MTLTLWWGLSILCSTYYSARATLLYPAVSVFQITSSFSVPIQLPDRKLFWNWGLQMNYDLPFNLQRFYSAPIWPGILDERKRRDIINQAGNIRNVTSWQGPDLKYMGMHVEAGQHPSDFTAGELYHSFENLLISYGFHETCLLRSVCELAHHPFSEDQQNILTDILTIILTPSLHEGFSAPELVYRLVYEEAERRGFMQYDCGALYNDCKQDLLTSFTNVVAG